MIFEGMPQAQEKKEAEQPAQRTVENLIAKSRFKRSEFASNCTIETEGRKFKIATIESGESPELSDVQKLFENVFGKEEVDSEEILRSAVDGRTPWDTEDTKYRIVTIRDEQEKLVSIAAGASLDLLDKEGEPTGETVYFVGYAVTDPEARQGGLAREAYISALIDAMEDSKKQGKVLKFAIGECTWTSEKFWNNVGWKRIYGQTGDKKEYTELEYMQPALDFDEKTGAIAKDAGEAPEHLMIDGFGPFTPGKEDIAGAFDSLMYFCADWPPEAFNNKKAYNKQQKYFNGVKSKFYDTLNSKGQLIFLDAENREKAKQEGVTVHDYTAADKGGAGEEDF